MHNNYEANPGSSVIKKDFQTIEWGRESNASWVIGKSSKPVFFTADGHNVHLQDSARGCSVLIVSDDFESLIDLTDVFIWSVGKAHKSANIWSPDHHNYDIKTWNNQSLIKLMPLYMAREKRKDGRLISHSPMCFYYRRHSSFNAASFLQEETIWNDGTKDGNILASIQLAIILGYRSIYLIADINTSSRTYQHVQQLNKLFINNGIKIYNCGDYDIPIFPKASIQEACSSCILE